MYDLGQQAFFVAMKLLTGERPQARRLDVSLQLRESTAPAAQRSSD
jgi:hypothetical protein